MTKIRKVKRRKKFRTYVNRKRLRNKQRKLPTISNPLLKSSWEVTVSTRTNLKEMGLSYDPNETLKIPNVKKELIEEAKRKITEPEEAKCKITKPEEAVWQVEDEEAVWQVEDEENEESIKANIAKELEAQAKAPRERLLRLPKSIVHFLTNLMDKYGEDYKAMARDKKNYNQMTWKQIRAKIKMFKGIPEQYNEYLNSKNAK